MPEKILLTLLFSLFLMTSGDPAYAQEPEEDMQQDTPEAEVAPQPEVSQQISTIMVEDGHLSVEFVNVNFGEILRSISQKAGFRLEGSSRFFNKKVTTKFTDLDMDKGLIRLFSLVKENNYLISYDAKGAVSKLKISSPGAPVGTTSPAPARIPVLRRRRGVPIPQRPAPQPQQEMQPAPQPQQETDENSENENDTDEF